MSTPAVSGRDPGRAVQGYIDGVPGAAAVIDVTPRGHAARPSIESFVRAVYHRAYGADIEVDYPRLMSVRSDGGALLTAAGIRCAAEGPLFLEHYTRDPVELVLQRIYGEKVPRRCVAEIGNLASGGGGVSILLFAALTAWLEGQGIAYAMVTVTEELHDRLLMLGLRPDHVCDASAASLPDAGSRWGSYYDTCPRVLAGPVARAAAELGRVLGPGYERLARQVDAGLGTLT